MFFSDYHIHTNFSSDSEAPMEDMINIAIKKGLKEIAFTDHVDLNPHYALTDYNNYLITFNHLKEKYSKKIILRFGVEMGLNFRKSSETRAFLESFPFDFVIGSSHDVCEKDLYYDDYFDDKTKKEAYSIYFEEVLENIKNIETFNVYGHLDFITRYGIYGDNSLKYEDYHELIDKVLKLLIEKNIGLEINTSGYRYNNDCPYPQIEILKKYRSLGGEIITSGSDAHRPEDIAGDFNLAFEIFEAAGFKYITTFENKKPNFTKIV